MQDLRDVVSDTEELFHATAADASTQASKARVRLEASLRSAKTRIAEAEDVLVAGARAAAQDADRYVRENPWPVIGVTAGVALAVGLLLGRR